ncbi:MAG TPA: histidine kinase dimerization/phospho-acceptor domain-containing protein [Candidatus Acidoferrales bacterium]|jgi:K+-sensing histidine kinase KdpD|nr:histidine kinase dimerization/phospho-acceptor domain-containing protein [Candidatus Acidoferrales bacterium]
MSPDNLRNLKHELRTPVNHILGYSSLLLDAADDAGDSTVAGMVNQISANAQVLVRMVEKNLVSPNGEMDETQLDALRANVRPVVGQILEALPADSEAAEMAPYVEDLERIRSAANDLLVLLETVIGSVRQ